MDDLEARRGECLEQGVARSQAQVLGEKLNMQWLFAPSENRWWHESFGNGVLSSASVRDWRRVPLAHGSVSRRPPGAGGSTFRPAIA